MGSSPPPYPQLGSEVVNEKLGVARTSTAFWLSQLNEVIRPRTAVHKVGSSPPPYPGLVPQSVDVASPSRPSLEADSRYRSSAEEKLLDRIAPAECRNYLANAGYEPT